MKNSFVRNVLNMHPVLKLLKTPINSEAIVLVTVSHFHPSLTFSGKVDDTRVELHTCP
jgi:hypothetical protein